MKLIVLKNNVPINDIELETADLTLQYEFFVGRADDCHVFIDDPLISRHHLVIKNDGPQWYCEKLTQLGVVTVNGNSSQKTPIFQGAEIRSGSYSIIVAQLESAAVSVLETPRPAPTYTPPAPTLETMNDDLPGLDALEELDETADLSGGDLGSDGGELAEGSDDLSEISTENSSLGESPLDDDASDMEQSLVPDGFNQSEEMSNEFGDGGDQGGELSEFSGALDDGPVEDEKTRVDQFFVNYQLTIFGEHAPYDRYQITQDEIFIGRDEKKCQIILNDPEVSSVHAVIRRSRIDMVLEDLNSSNGTILNGERINRAQIGPGDEFVIGGTSFTLEVQSELLEAEKNRLMPVERNQVIEKEEIEEEIVDVEDGDINFDSAPVEKSLLKRVWKDPVKRKKLIYGIVGATLLVVLLYEPSEEIPKEKPIVKKEKVEKPKLQLSEELQKRRNVAYETGVSYFDQNKYYEAEKEFQIVVSIDPNYKNVQTYLEQSKAGLKKIAELEAEKRAREQAIKTKKEVEELLVKARDAVKEHQVELANTLFSQIVEKDPENTDVSLLRQELESWQREQERIALEKAAKEASRRAMVNALSPGKTFYLKKEWYRAILKLEEFLQKKGMDEDLIKEGSDMLSDARNQLASDLGPLLGKAKSFKEGQDLKNAYETFLEVLRLEPTNTEALNEVEDIRSQLDARSKKIYREAIIAESLSLFSDAKEKFQEVQQVSPTDSDYYKKATEKLKNYLE